MHDQIGVSSYAAPDQKCDNQLCAPTLVSKLLIGNKLRIAVRRLEDGRQQCGSSFRRTAKESAKHKVALPIVHPKFDLGFVPSACVVEGDEELTPRGNDCGTTALHKHSENPSKQMRTTFWTGRLGCNVSSLVSVRVHGVICTQRCQKRQSAKVSKKR